MAWIFFLIWQLGGRRPPGRACLDPPRAERREAGAPRKSSDVTNPVQPRSV